MDVIIFFRILESPNALSVVFSSDLSNQLLVQYLALAIKAINQRPKANMHGPGVRWTTERRRKTLDGDSISDDDEADNDDSYDSEEEPGAYAMHREGLAREDSHLHWDPTDQTESFRRVNAINQIKRIFSSSRLSQTQLAINEDSTAALQEADCISVFTNETSQTQRVAAMEAREEKRRRVGIYCFICLLLVSGSLLGVFLSKWNPNHGKMPSTTTTDLCAYLREDAFINGGTNSIASTSMVDPFRQCMCDDKIAMISETVVEHYSKLKSSEPLVEFDGGLPMSSCEPTNIALVWLAYDGNTLNGGRDGTPTDETLFADNDFSTLNNTVGNETKNAIQRFVLAYLYASLGGSGGSWIKSDFWVSPKDECLWYGITCDPAGRVVELALGSNRLVGEWTSETSQILAQLTSLQKLELNSNELRGQELPLQLSPTMTYLDVSNNMFGGNLSALAHHNVALLQYLLVGHNELHGSLPSQVFQQQLTSLIELDLSHNRFVGPLLDLLPSSNSTSVLEKLSVSNTFLRGTLPDEIGEWTTLKSLDISRTRLRGTLPTELGLLTELSEMMCSENSDMSGTIPTELGNLEKMQKLGMAESGFSGTIPTELVQLSLLESIHLQANELTGTIPPFDTSHSNMLEFTVFANEGLSGTLPSTLVHLTFLHVAFTSLTGSIPCGDETWDSSTRNVVYPCTMECECCIADCLP